MNRPPVQTKLSFGEDDELEVKVPDKIEPVFEVGDKVRENPDFPHIGGVFTVESVILTWGEPLYFIVKREKRKDGKIHSVISCCTSKALVPLVDLLGGK